MSEEALPALANEALTLFPFSCYLALPLTSNGNLKTINLLVLLYVLIFTRTFCGGGVADGIVSMYLKLNNFLQSVSDFYELLTNIFQNLIKKNFPTITYTFLYV